MTKENVMPLERAILEAAFKCEGWKNGAAVVKDEDGYECVPADSIKEQGYTVHDIVYTVKSPEEMFGREFDRKHTTVVQIKAYIAGTIVPELKSAGLI